MRNRDRRAYHLRARETAYKSHGSEPDSEARREALREFIEAGKVTKCKPGEAKAKTTSDRWWQPQRPRDELNPPRNGRIS